MASSEEREEPISSSTDEEDGASLISHEEPQDLERVTLPWKQLAPLCVLQVSESFNSSGLFSYSAFLVSDFLAVPIDSAGFAAGFLQAASYFGMFLSSFWWGAASDRFGKRPMLLLGTVGSLVSCLAFGFSVNMYMAVSARLANGLLNGNLGIAKSYLGAITTARNQARAFALIAVCWGAGALVGAAVGGVLARPAIQYPSLFATSGFFGTFPYLLPNLVTAAVNLAGLIGGYMYLTEPTIDTKHASNSKPQEHSSVWRQKKAMLAAVTYVFLGFVFVLYEEVMPLFLAATTGGMGLSTAQIGLFESILGGVFLVSSGLAPRVPERIGLIQTHRLGLILSVPLMLATPLLGGLAKGSAVTMWAVLSLLCVAWGISDNFSFAPVMVLVANSTRKSQLGTLNGVAQSGVALMRATGPILGGIVFAWSLEPGHVFPLDVFCAFFLMAFCTLLLLCYSFLLPMELNKPFVEEVNERELSEIESVGM